MNEIEIDFEIEPELQGSCPRQVVPTKATLFMRRLAWNGQLAILSLICFLASRDISDVSRLVSSGRVLNTYVVKSVKSSNDSEDSSCTVYYAARRDSIGPEGTFHLTNSSRRIPEPGDAFQVTYLPGDTSVYREGTISPESIGVRRTFWVYIAFVWSIPYLAIVWMVVCYHVRRRRLLAYGIAEIATVRSRRIVKGDESDGHYLNYSYSLSDRRQRCGETHVTKAIFAAYPEGRKFSVLIDPAGHSRSAPYFGFSSYQIRDAPKRSFL